MRVRDLLPEWVKEYRRIQRLRRRYPGRQIYSCEVDENAVIGVACYLGKLVVIGPGVEIGNYSYINQGSVVISGSIGNYCSIGYYCQIGMFEHPKHHFSTSPFTYREGNQFGVTDVWDELTSPPTIGSDVWIGSHVTVMQRVTIGHGAIIGAGAIVTKDVPPYAIACGVPAHVIGSRFSDEIIEELLQSEWWNKPVAEVRQQDTTYLQSLDDR